MLHGTIHNVAKRFKTGLLWLLDIHQQMLETTCIFRRNTVNRLHALHKSADPAKLLLKFVSDNEPLFETALPTERYKQHFTKHFCQRIDQLWQWIGRCRRHVNHY